MNTFFTADQHFGHENLVVKSRTSFSDAREMNDYLVEQWNSRVKPRDRVYHLGDFAWRNPDYYAGQLNGRIILFRGNHDHNQSMTKLRACFSEVHDVGMIKLDGKEIWLNHYAQLVWPKRHYGAWHLFGHSHGALLGLPGSLDVGVDTHPNYAPYAWDEVKERMTAFESEPSN